MALPSQTVSGLVVAGDHGLGLGLALLLHGPVPLTPSLLQPASPQTPLLQVDPAQLIVHGRVVQEVEGQQHHDEEPVDPHADQSCVVTVGRDRLGVLEQLKQMIYTPHVLSNPSRNGARWECLLGLSLNPPSLTSLNKPLFCFHFQKHFLKFARLSHPFSQMLVCFMIKLDSCQEHLSSYMP